ncbi:MAG: hypothetical protein ACOY4C_04595 [Pseudomonadota bacterium]
MNELLPIVVEGAGKTTSALGAAVSHTLSDVWNGVIGDRTAAWRLKRMISIQKSVEAILHQKNVLIDRVALPEHYALRWFEEASKSEESPVLSDLFARLLLGTASGKSDARQVSLLSIVSSMSGSDASCFKDLINNLIYKYEINDNKYSVKINTTKEKLYDYFVSLDVLAYLGLLKIESDDAWIGVGESGMKYPNMEIVYWMGGGKRVGAARRIALTWLGLALARVIMPDDHVDRLIQNRTP